MKMWKDKNFDEKQNTLYWIFKWMMLINIVNASIQAVVYGMFGLM